MRKLFLSVHDDDNALFGAITCLREKPDVLIVLDSFVQPNRGEIGCDAITRAKETEEACAILGCKVLRVGLQDDTATERDIEYELRLFIQDYDVIFVPALQGGNVHHDMVSRAASKVFHRKKVYYYTTYTKTELWTKGTIEIIPTPKEEQLKWDALQCYESQINLPSTAPHFLAVQNKSEWFL